MGRIARVVMPGQPHHVTQRGVRSMDVFLSDDDRMEYLRLMKAQASRFDLRVLSYCLMSNHVHLIVVPKRRESLAMAIGETHRLYTRYINFSNHVRGHLFQERFFSCPLDEHHLLAAVRYVERNPVRAGLVRCAWRYTWSSARFHVGKVSADPLVTDRTLAGVVDDWRELLRDDPQEMAILREKVRTGRPCGNDIFIRKAEKLTQRRLHPKAPGRPKLSTGQTK